MTSTVQIETIRNARRQQGYMDAKLAAQLKPGDVLAYPEAWPTEGPQALAEPCEIFAITETPFSETGYTLYFHGRKGRTVQLDASWFKPPKRLIVANEVAKSEWEF
jgi:hypothetical protein